MKVVTKKAIAGKKLCSCGGELYMCESETQVNPLPGRGHPYNYIMEFSICNYCGQEIILYDSIIINEEKARIAKIEASPAWKLKKWLTTD